MNIKRFYMVSRHSMFTDLALLLIRAVAGLAFTVHGWGKIQNPFGWMGPEGFAPGIFQALWILGLLTPLASFGIASTMAVAFSFHAFMRGDPFVSMTGGPASELAALYFSIALLLMAAGPGRFSLDRMFLGRR